MFDYNYRLSTTASPFILNRQINSNVHNTMKTDIVDNMLKDPFNPMLNIKLGMPNLVITKDNPKIKKVIFNPPATIVFWDDGSKTVVKDTDNDWEKIFNAKKYRKQKIASWKEAGILNAIAKKYYHNYQDIFTTWIDELC